MKAILSLVTICFFSVQLTAQTNSVIKGSVKAKDAAAASASVALLKAKDSSLVKLAVTNAQGQYEFNEKDSLSYFIKVTSVGFAASFSETFLLMGAKTVGDIELLPEPQSIAGVTVQAKRPMVEARLDKMVVNVDASPSNSGSTALELLQKSPGITVDKDGNINLKGKRGVIVLIDGKQTYLSGQELANYLRSMPASQLDQLEIITQPSAKFDAAGNSGILNLKMKKNRQLGFNGSVSVTYAQGKYAKSPNSFNFNYRKGKVNIFTGGGFSYWKNFGKQTLYRRFENGGDPYAFDQKESRVNEEKSFNARLGMDYNITPTAMLGFMVKGTTDREDENNYSIGDFFYERTRVVDSSILANARSSQRFKNLTSNINFKKTLDKKGKELSADIDYVKYQSKNSQFTENTAVFPVGPSSTYLLRANLPSNIDIYSAKVDYVHPLPKEAKFEAGAKTSIVKTDNNAPYETFNEGQGKWVDDVRKDHFAYDEQITAGYVNYSRQVKKWGFQSGLRGEYTASSGKQILISKRISRHYFQLFPTAYISYAMNDNNQFGLNYGRRIERPNYRDLNPFVYFLDLYTYQKGNPYLRPQFTNNVEFSHIYKSKLNTTLSYSSTVSIINDILKQDDQSKVTYQTKENIASRQNLMLSMSYNAPVTKWWTTSLYGQVYYQKYSGIVNDEKLSVNVTAYQFSINQQFKFAKTWTAEASGYYLSEFLETSLFLIKPLTAASFGISKEILKGKGTVKIGSNDVFYTNKPKVIIKQANVDAVVTNRWDNRRFNINFTYRFNKGQNVQQRNRKSGSEDEQNRIR